MISAQSFTWETPVAMLEDGARQSPDAVAIEAVGCQALTYARLTAAVHALMNDLAKLGIGRGDRVGIVLPNGAEMAIALLAVSSTAVCAPINPAYQTQESVACLDDLRVELLLVGEGMSPPASTAAQKLGIAVAELSSGLDNGRPFRLRLRPHTEPPPRTGRQACRAELDDVAVVLQTSGTTARPKTVPLTHRNIRAAVGLICNSLQLSPDDCCLALMPQFHIGGLVDLLLAPLAAGGRVVYAGDFRAERFFACLQQYKPTWCQVVPTTMVAILEHSSRLDLRPADTCLRFLRCVAAALRPADLQAAEELFNVPVVVTFGMTEAAPLITSTSLSADRRKAGSVGRSVGPEVAIMDDQGNLLPPGTPGEVVVRGENIMAGYENDPEANAVAFAHGWFHTGDLGHLDEDGCLFLGGRVKEIINRGGEKISPAEVDLVLLDHPAVAAAACFPIPHERLGEDIAAAVVRHPGAAVTEQELRDFVAQRLAPFKAPRIVVFVDCIPKGPTGKIQRLLLAAQLPWEPSAGASGPGRTAAPRTPAELKIAAIWSDILKLDRLNVNDGFFELGGDSLQAVELFAQLEQEFGRRIPVNMIFRFPTITAQAALLENAEAIVPQTRAAAIRRAEQIPMFWIQFRFDPGNMPVIPLETLWERPPNRDVFGMSVEQLAADYVKQIRDCVPAGPCCLGGYSMGGLLALETARQLEAFSRPVPLLFLVDPAAPRDAIADWQETRDDRLAELAGGIREKGLLHVARSKFQAVVNVLSSPIKTIACRHCLKTGKPFSVELRRHYAARVYARAVADYAPETYSGTAVVYFTASHQRTAAASWNRIIPDATVQVLDIADHFQVMRSPWNRQWLADLGSRLTGLES